MIGTVDTLWRYPVKSMAGERLESAALSWRGIPGDRGWAVFDEARGGVTGAKRIPPLRTCTARYAREPVAGEASPPAEIRLPERQVIEVEIDRTMTSCGYGVPVMSFVQDRTLANRGREYKESRSLAQVRV